MIAPASDEQRAKIVCGKPIGFVADDSRGGFARSRNHRQRAGKFTVPTRKRMSPLASVAEPITVIATGNDMQQATRRATVRVVVERKKVAESIEATGVRIPESRRPSLQFRTIRSATINVSTLCPAGQRHSIAADDFVVGTQVLTETEIQMTESIKGKPGQPVVRVVTRRFQMH